MLPQLINGAKNQQASDRATELLNLVGLENRSTHRPSQLSGGEQQRVAFCRAVANSPKLLLADEPTGNLDERTSDTVFEALLSLVEGTDMAALIATHNEGLAKKNEQAHQSKKVANFFQINFYNINCIKDQRPGPT